MVPQEEAGFLARFCEGLIEQGHEGRIGRPLREADRQGTPRLTIDFARIAIGKLNC